ncbi:sugar ABC transporter permease [Paenibacillus marchantiophytorum]|uniref:Sugar ABC transporter permease n=1 Tax=Paenibacillus marchantiophytorum TaxID=1619310 RepID=A0ABQ1EKS9_9BACL|nr:ABC transporter permease subunit [Paenibacillus marchantiophytorum]GFZ75768.1 sugar ABC transporter permease [Paenibacillus marchantiophytorum]
MKDQAIRKGSTGRWKRFKQNKELFILSLPALIFKLIFNYLPLIGLIVAFKKFRFDGGIFGSPWNGFDNFRFFFVSDNAWRITRNTVLYNLGFIAITMVCALILAVLLNELSSRAVKIYQTALFLPYFLSWVVVGYIALAFLEQDRGLLDHVWTFFGLEPVNWYQAASRWPYILNAVNLWKTVGFSTLVYFAGIIGISPTYYEAAKIDGANKFQMVRTITLPLLTPLIIVLFIVAIGGIFRADFGLFYFIPNNASFLYSTTDVIDTYVFRALRTIGDVGMSAAVGLYQSVVGFILVVLSNWIIKKINSDNALW